MWEATITSDRSVRLYAKLTTRDELQTFVSVLRSMRRMMDGADHADFVDALNAHYDK